MSETRQDLLSDPQLSRLYRQFATAEPPPPLDRTILAAAQAAVAEQLARARRGGWWQRWRVPLALTTTLTLSVMLALMHEKAPTPLPAEPHFDRQPAEALRERPAKPEATPVPSPAPMPTPAAAPPAAVALEPALAPPDARAKVARQAPGFSEQDARSRNQARSSSEREMFPAEERAAAAPTLSPEAKREAVPATPAITAGAVAGRGTESRDETRLEAATTAPAAKDSAPALGKARADSPRPAAAWLDEIRALLREGRVEEARRQLREFRRAYPDYVLPDDLRGHL